ncbi:MAG: ATP-grasp domain-containing protein [Chloroflexota bacterium]
MTPTLILSHRYTEDSQRLWQAAIQLGWRVERLHSWHIPEHLQTINEPVIYIEALMASIVAEFFGQSLIEPPEDWLPSLPEAYRQRTVQLTTLGTAHDSLLPAFVKPPNDKSFTARVYDTTTLPTDYPEEMSVLVAEPVVWEKEFRCFILDRQLRTSSIYLRNGELQRAEGFVSTVEEQAELQQFVETLLNDTQVELSRAAVLDVGVIKDRGWAVVEQNSPWGAGIYGCDPAEVLEVLRFTSIPSRPPQ